MSYSVRIQPEKILTDNADITLARKNKGFTRVNETPITIFQSGHGYAKASANGTVNDDTLTFFKGAQSLQLVSPSNGTSVFAEKLSLSPTLNLTGQYLKIWVKVDNPNSLTELWVYTSSDNMASAWYVWKFTKDVSIVKPNVWQCLTCSFGDVTTVGAPNRSAINAVRIRVTSATGSSVTVNWGGIHMVPEPSAGVATFAFDDGFSSVFTKAKVQMDLYGYHGIAYIIAPKLDTSGRLTSAQVKQLYSEGWDMACHDSPPLDEVSLNDAEILSKHVKYTLMSLGCARSCEDYAFPEGHFSEEIIAMMQKYFRTTRSIVEGQAETIPPADPYKLRILNITQLDNFTTIQSRITQAKNNKEWLIMVFHNIVDSVTDSSTQISTSLFNQIVNEVNTQGLTVKTVDQVINEN